MFRNKSTLREIHNEQANGNLREYVDDHASQPRMREEYVSIERRDAACSSFDLSSSVLVNYIHMKCISKLL